MILLRKIVFPFAILYGTITSIRNFLYDKGVFKSYTFPVPVIAVGNLSVGGTGKTPQIEYLIRLLSDSYRVATLSRGYKRQSKGFHMAYKGIAPQLLGDEPFQFFKKFPYIQVAVDTDRKNGIEKLLSQKNPPELILLDDAFQHRKVKAGLYILLTAYNDLYIDDWMLPAGNLRETKSGARRADVIVVTKCPINLSEHEQESIRQRLQPQKHQMLFFSTIGYDDCIYSESETFLVSQIKSVDKLLIAGIAKPESFFEYLQNQKDCCLKYPDHHNFSDSDIRRILKKAQNQCIITTEKDYVRLQGKLPKEQLFYLPVKSVFINNSETFNNKIVQYVEQSSGNR